MSGTLQFYRGTKISLTLTYTADGTPVPLDGKNVGFHIALKNDEKDFLNWFSDDGANSYGSILEITDEDAGEFAVAIEAEESALITFDNGRWYLTVDNEVFGRGILSVDYP